MPYSAISDRTAQMFSDALEECIKDKKIKDITITQLCAQAGLNRKTFYYHFESIRDLCIWIYRRYGTLVARQADYINEPERSVKECVEYVNRHFLLYKRLSEYLGLDTIREITADDKNIMVLYESVLKMARDAGVSISHEYADFTAQFFCNAYTDMMFRYLTGETKWSNEQIEKYIARIWKYAIPAIIQGC